MEKYMINKMIMLNIGIIALAGILRVLPHPWNFTPVIAACMYSGFYMNNRILAVLLPLLTVFAGDLVLGLYSGMTWVYSSYICVILLGFLFSGSASYKKVGLLTISGSLAFFLISNFGVWLSGMIYPKTMSGFISCYAAALPFFQNSILGTIFYSGVFFGITELLIQKSTDRQVLAKIS